MTLSNTKKLEQAQKRQKKREVDECLSQSSSVDEISSQDEAPAAKRLRSSLGVIHDKNKCVWCCKPESAKHPESKLLLISYDHAWAAFKSHTVALEDQKMRDRINCLIDSAADQPYALEIKYHHKWWLKYVRKFQKMSEDDKLPQMQNITYREVQTMFFDHTQKVIFEEHELRSLQSLLRDYCSIISRFGFPTSGVRSSFIKEILRREFKERISFYSRPERNHSELVYDVSGGGSYVEAALSSIGISAEQLIYNVAERLREENQICPMATKSRRVGRGRKPFSSFAYAAFCFAGKEEHRTFSVYCNTHFSSHAVCHEATYNNFHQCQHHPSWGDSQQRAY